MKIAVRAIVIQDESILVMYRNKYGSQYYTLVGGRAENEESAEHALKREVKEETGLDIVTSKLVFIEKHKGFYSDQYIYLCEVSPNASLAVQDDSEEGKMNKFQANIHRPEWTRTNVFSKLPFRTIQLQNAITKCLKDGFPDKPIDL